MPEMRFTLPAMLVLTVLALTPHLAVSQDEPEPESSAVAWYQVELIVFAQGSGSAPTGEDFSPVPSDWVYMGGVFPGEDSGVIMSPDSGTGADGVSSAIETDPATTERTDNDASLGAATDSDAAVAVDEQERRFVPVDDSALSLNAYYETLRRRDAYQPLLYLAWAQPGYAAEAAPVLPVDVFGGAGPGLDGNVSMYRSRYLHLQLDLKLQPDQAQSPAPAASIPFILETEMPRFELAQKRRMRSNEIHYFDHPRLGALAVIRPLDEAPRGAVPVNP